MRVKNIWTKLLLLSLPVFALAFNSCQKMSRPALGDYPKDVPVTPTTELRFYVPFDSTSPADKQINIRFKDSISGYPSFFPDKSIGVADGVHGTAVQLSLGNALKYISANDFAATAQSFTLAMWEKAPGVPHANPEFVMSLVDKDYWHNSGMFLLFDHDGAGSTADSAAVSFVVKDNWYVFHNKDRIPKIYDQQWHHLVFVYDATTSKLATYVDGQALTGLSNDATTQLSGPLNLTASSVSNMVIGGWNKHAAIDGPTDAWIDSFPGLIDQFRLYNKALSASDILALYNAKM
ncbi:MAG TPA: LamG domain-containing protein [Chitinophagaceae bacterium]|nr:LamG domain-containing protein [Chitinophagaceae bacterium]